MGCRSSRVVAVGDPPYKSPLPLPFVPQWNESEEMRKLGDQWIASYCTHSKEYQDQNYKDALESYPYFSKPLCSDEWSSLPLAKLTKVMQNDATAFVVKTIMTAAQYSCSYHSAQVSVASFGLSSSSQ